MKPFGDPAPKSVMLFFRPAPRHRIRSAFTRTPCLVSRVGAWWSYAWPFARAHAYR